MRIERAAAALLFATLLLPGTASAAPGDTVSVLACARAGVEAKCLVITAADGRLYNITSANPRPPLDVRIQLRGTETDKVSFCNQGLVVENITWTATQEKCGN